MGTYKESFIELIKGYKDSGLLDYEFYDFSAKKYNENAQSRICHISLKREGNYNKDAIVMVFTIGSNVGRTVIQSEGARTDNPSSTYPQKTEAIRLAQENKWKYIAVAISSKDFENETIRNYIVSIESTDYAKATVCVLDDCIQYLKNNNLPPFYRCTQKANGVEYTLSFIKKDGFLDYVKLYDNRPEVERYGKEGRQDEIDWHALEPTEEEYANFKALLNFFVSQLNINNDLIPGEKRFVDSGKPNSRAFVEQWRFNGFELSCKFAKGYQKTMDNASYLNYWWVNINPHYNKTNKNVESIKVNVKPDMNLCHEGQPYNIASLDLSSDDEPNEQLRNLFIEFRDEIYKWQCGVYTHPHNNEEKEICYKTSLQNDLSRNRIIFGAPGTGKSYTLNKECEELIGKDNEPYYERVTFHPDYSYANFVGTYKPVPSIDSDGKDAITYEYVPGPFMRVYVNALKNGRTDEVKPFLLVIEEINRANVAAVFGDIFQLLDRDENNVSEYPIQASEDMKKYLAKELGGEPDDYQKIKLPNNMFIWATMNSADQGVFPMDTAFKRRWDFTYLGIDDNDERIKGKYVKLGKGAAERVIEWNSLRKAINLFLAKASINEDKQLGPYFLSKKIVIPNEGEDIDASAFIEAFKNKVIMYLFEDAAKQKRASLFAGCNNDKSRYSEICNDFDEHGISIFNQEIISKVKEKSTTEENESPD